MVGGLALTSAPHHATLWRQGSVIGAGRRAVMGAPRGRKLAAAQVATCVVAAVLLAACSYLTPSVDQADRGAAVRGAAGDGGGDRQAWLGSASEKTGDLGWGLLYPTIRTDMFGSEDRYRGAVGGSDWSSFRYRVLGADLHDGEYQVRIEIERSSASVPVGLGFVQMQSEDVGFVVGGLGVGASRPAPRP